MNNKPVAYAMFRDGEYYDAIHPDEQAKTTGEYDIPLYTYQKITPSGFLNASEPVYPVKTLTDEEIHKLWLECWDEIDFARAILRKAQE